MTDLWQHAVVALAALAAGAVIAWRVFGFFGTGDREPRCANCQPRDGACAPAARDGRAAAAGSALGNSAPSNTVTTHPAVFIRQPR